MALDLIFMFPIELVLCVQSKPQKSWAVFSGSLKDKVASAVWGKWIVAYLPKNLRPNARLTKRHLSRVSKPLKVDLLVPLVKAVARL